MKVKFHAAVGALALLTVVTFWLSTVFSELFAGPGTIAAVKGGILMGMVVMIPAMAATGASGFSLGRRWRNPVLDRKKRRMAVIAANGLLVLLPSAFLLADRAQAGRFDTVFYALQALELAAGAANILLLSLNMRDGFALRRRKVLSA